MNWTATPAEINILTFLNGSLEKSIQKEELIKHFGQGEENLIKRALEGCVEKAFITENNGVLTLTELGKKQI